MSEYWKSTPRYWCKHCSCYVRDTKLERQNHEATAKHQGALRRSLRDLHRNHEREERDKERARLEIARLNGAVSGPTPSFKHGSSSSAAPHAKLPAATAEAERKRQREQLAELGVAVPSSFRPEMAMAGEWTITSTRVIDSGEITAGAVARGVRKREETEEQKEEEAAVRRLFKKPRRWGRDSKTMPDDEDSELDALLSGTGIALKKHASGDDVPGVDGEAVADCAKVKKEEHVKTEETKQEGLVTVKHEPDGDATAGGLTGDSTPGVVAGRDDAAEPAPVVFKKRKPKGMRTK